MTLRACFLTLTTPFLLTPCLAGEFGQTHQYFAQYGVGGPAETAFTIHDPGDAAILVEVALINSDGSLFQMEEVAVGPGAAETVVFSDPEGEVRNGWARLTSDAPFSATVFFRIEGVGNVSVLPSEKGVKFKLFSFVGRGTDTGFAVANTSETEESIVTTRIFSTAGVFQREVEKTYGPGEHEALFVTQEPLLVEGDSLIEFTATQPVILLGLRSDNNLLASTAVIRPEGTGVEPGSINTEHLADGAVTGDKIAEGAVVRSLNGLTDNVTLAAGDNVTVTPNGQTLTIAATGGGGSGGDITAVNAGDGLTGGGNSGSVSLAIADSGITSTHLADDSVGLSELAPEVSFGRVEGSNIILGDSSNSAQFVSFATVGGGRDNTVAGVRATIGGGQGNMATATGATVGGGESNQATGVNSTAAGGDRNEATGARSTVGGGDRNEATGANSTVGGGEDNAATGVRSTVGRGWSNTASGDRSTVAGGSASHASGARSTVGGGSGNAASGDYSTTPGGQANTASGPYSFAAGHNARALCGGCFAWADSHDFNFNVTGAPNRFWVRATGGARFVSAINAGGSAIAGVKLDSGAGSWSSISDRESKDNIRSVDSRLLLEKLSEVPIATWNYKAQAKNIRHIGPMAQDFHAAFGVGEDERHITTIDADGVALAAIQGLYQLLQEKDREMEELEKAHIYIEQLHNQNKSLEAELRDVQQVVAELVEKVGH